MSSFVKSNGTSEPLVQLVARLRDELKRERATADGLRQALVGSGIAALVLDANLKIRFFTPAIGTFFELTDGDLGRPLADVALRNDEAAYVAEAVGVLEQAVPQVREVPGPGGTWHLRRIVPYRARNRVRGVVVSFLDITEQHRAALAMADTAQQARRANVAKSRTLAAASHDLRQPLQALRLLESVLIDTVDATLSRTLVAQIDPLLDAMTGALDTMLDTARPEAGATPPGSVSIDIGGPQPGAAIDQPTHAADAGGEKIDAVGRPASQLPRTHPQSEPPVVYVVDDDGFVRDGVRSVLERDGLVVEDFSSAEAFLDTYRADRGGCILIDAYLPGIDGLELLQRLSRARARLPAIMITGRSDVPMAVQAMKAGATDYIEKPIGGHALLASVQAALAQWQAWNRRSARREAAIRHLAGLTSRQRQIMALVLSGQPNKNIAADLGISQRTVEHHRALIMKKTGSKSLPALVRVAAAALTTAIDRS